MKIVINKMPKTPRDCLFSELIPHSVGVYGCTLRGYIEKIDGKPRCLCKSVDKCDRLIEFGELKSNQGDNEDG